MATPDQCPVCKKPLREGEVEYRLASTIKLVAKDGRELPGNPLELGFIGLCQECAAAQDAAEC